MFSKLFSPVILFSFFTAQAHASLPIIGGDQVIASDIISRITAGLISGSANGTALCTVSIVASDLAVTAGHCARLNPGDPRAVLTLVFGRDLRAQGNPTRTVDRVEVPNDATDVALLHFTGGLPEGYQFAKLMPFDQILSRGDAVMLAGYGIYNAERNDGEGFLRKVQVTVLNANYSSTEIEFDQSHGHGACHGDSGGPAYLMINQKPYLFGITSRGGGNCNQSVIYSRIGALSAWFTDAAAKIRKN